MKTREILLNIIGNLERDENFLKRIPADDIISCVYIELYGLRQIYSRDHFDRLEQELFRFAGKLTAAISANDSALAKEIISKIAELQDHLPDNDISLDFIEKANYNKALVRHKRDNTIIVLGDSHVNFFSGNEELSFIPIGGNVNTCEQINGLPFTVLHLGPGLAYNSDNYNSSSGFREKLEWLLENFISEGAEIISVLGEVDMRAHVFKQCQKQGKGYEEIVEDIVIHYMNYLKWLKEKGFKVIVWGPIASQGDDCPMTKDYPRVGTEQERNMATAYFTKRMAEECRNAGIGFLSIFREMVTADYRTKQEYISSDHCHLGQRCFGKVLEQMYKGALWEK